MSTVACAVTLPAAIRLIWLRVDSPVLTFACGMQWLQVVTPILYCNFQDIPTTELYDTLHLNHVTYLSLIGIIVLSGGIRCAWIGMPQPHPREVENILRGTSQHRVFAAWICAFAIATVAGVVAWYAPGITQLIYAIVIIKWVMFIVLGCRVLSRNEGHTLLLVAIAVEFISGFLGFFASFKEVLLMLLVIMQCMRRKWQMSHLIAATAAFGLLVTASLLWTAVKQPYRAYLKSEVKDKPIAARLIARAQRLQELLLELESEDLNKAVESLVQRIGYTEYFAHAMDFVPGSVPFENGSLWRGAIAHVLHPRLFFRDKAAISDSLRLTKYTGIKVAGAEQGTSIGIGYMGESYIDFGTVGMFVPIFLLGLTYGSVYRLFVHLAPSRILGVAMATAVLFSSYQAVATSNIKLVGGLATQCIIMLMLNWILGQQLMKWLVVYDSAPVRRGVNRPFVN